MSIFQANLRDDRGCDTAAEQIAELIDKLSFNLSVKTRRKNHAATSLSGMLFNKWRILKVDLNETIKSLSHFSYSLIGGFTKDTNIVAVTNIISEYTHCNVVKVFFGVTT
ncbi:MAG: hypothetical protein OQJ95_02510 [Kangiella sp.]|jgi:hypothetical protein|nr:hypothetical protein [Kangiella sp.]MCW9027768.1 hypothetical protein [Kangiella sp.]